MRTIAAFFEWLQKERKLRRDNPFDGLAKSVRPNGKKVKRKIRAWHAEELVTLIEGLDPRAPYWSLVVLAIYSGCRISELCGMKLQHTAHRCLSVTRDIAKTDHSVRSVPIHPIIAPLVAKLIETSFDGYLISGLLLAGEDKRRGAYPSKQFSIIRHQLGLSDPLTVFHSTRHNFTTALERAGVPHNVMQRLTGHAFQNITLDRYSDGPELATFRDAVARVTYDRRKSEDYPAITVDALVTAKLADFEGNTAWKHKGGRAVIPTAVLGSV
ncbi:tyrosine-type recombinase/integrase [Pseudoxanthomonas sp. USHLN014]|uniref:tyrosine-type recombinase/integrase n=1 Tax=Pseudoxanthomonas sp. USHLN014 TaxID=3081297 RepID=UPI00301BB910